MNKIINPVTHHLDLFFDENWDCKSTLFSYGHDIEAAWLIDEAAVVLGDVDLLKRVHKVIGKVADAAAEGVQPTGAIVNEKKLGNGTR